MVGGMMTCPIKISWFYHPGQSRSLVHLVRGGGQPNLTEGSLSAAMSCVVQENLVDLGWLFVKGDNLKSTLADIGHYIISNLPYKSKLKRQNY